MGMLPIWSRAGGVCGNDQTQDAVLGSILGVMAGIGGYDDRAASMDGRVTCSIVVTVVGRKVESSQLG